MIIHKCDRCGRENDKRWKELRIEMDEPQTKDPDDDEDEPTGSMKGYEVCTDCRKWILDAIHHYGVRPLRPHEDPSHDPC